MTTSSICKSTGTRFLLLSILCGIVLHLAAVSPASEPDIVVNENDEILVDCHLTKPGAVSWQRDALPLTMFPGTREQVQGGQLDYSLKIIRARPIDSGRYSCFALPTSADESPVVASTRTVFVRTPPTQIEMVLNPASSFDHERNRIVVFENQPQEVRCRVTGSNSPAGAVMFVGNNEENSRITKIGECERNDVLLYDDCVFSYSPAPEDNGKNLTCRATHEVLQRQNGVLAESLRLEVEYAPRTKIIATTVGTVVAGTNVTLQCVLDANPPIQRTTVQWLRGSTAVPYSENSDDLFIKNASPVRDTGEYKCNVNSAVAAANMVPYMVRVVEPQQQQPLRSGSSASLMFITGPNSFVRGNWWWLWVCVLPTCFILLVAFLIGCVIYRRKACCFKHFKRSNTGDVENQQKIVVVASGRRRNDNLQQAAVGFDSSKKKNSSGQQIERVKAIDSSSLQRNNNIVMPSGRSSNAAADACTESPLLPPLAPSPHSRHCGGVSSSGGSDTGADTHSTRSGSHRSSPVELKVLASVQSINGSGKIMKSTGYNATATLPVKDVVVNGGAATKTGLATRV